MQTRKLQKVGGSTFTVSVPKRWAREHDLEAGDEIHLYGHDDGSLVVRSAEIDGGDLAAARIEIERPNPEVVTRALKATYAAGFDEVTLTASAGFTADQRRTAAALAKTLVGTELVEEREDRLVVRNLLDSADVSVRQSVRQLQFVALSMHRTATDAVAAGGRGAEQVAARDDEADRLFEMVARHFNRSLTDFEELDHLGVGRPELFDCYLTARQLERVADHAVRIAAVAQREDAEMTFASGADAEQSVGASADDGATAARGTDARGASAKLDDEIADRLRTVAEDARKVVEDATGAVLGEPAVGTPREVLDRRDETLQELDAVERALFERDPAGVYPTTRVLDSLVRTAEYGGNVAEIAVQSAVRGKE